jgi:hypothetical protein
MEIGIGLPATIRDIPGRPVLEWATAAERAGFSTLGTIDRLVHPSLETAHARGHSRPSGSRFEGSVLPEET